MSEGSAIQRTQTTCLVILTTIAVSFSLYYLKSVLLPFVIAVFVVIGCQPIFEFVEKTLKLRKFLAYCVTFLSGVALLVGFSLLIWMSIDNLAKNSSVYEQRFENIVEWVAEQLAAWNGSGTSNAESSPEKGDSVPESKSELPKSSNASQALDDLLVSSSKYIQSQLLNLFGSLSSLLSYGILILIFVFFLLLGRTELDPNQKAPKIIVEVENKIRQYLVMKTVISALTGFAFGFVLWLFGVPLAIVFGLLAFLLNFIPNIGPLISMLLPVPFLVLNAEMSPVAAIVCFVLISTIQFVSGNVIETRIMGKSFDVSPIVLLLSLMFFGLVWGIIGMFLATPIVSILKIVLQQNEATKPIGELMAGRWTAD